VKKKFSFNDNTKLNPDNISNPLKLSEEIIVGRVKNIFLENTNADNLGAIEIEPINPYSKTLIKAYPFFPNSISYPLLDEIVLCNYLPSENLGSSSANKKYYYVGIVNVWNNPHVNFYPNLEEGRANIPNSENKSIQDIQAGSKIVLSENDPNGVPSTQSTFKERDNIHPLKPYMGDVIHQGRFGNSIRFSSTASPINTEWSSTGKNGDPILILRNGQPLNNLPNNPWTPITENINEDPSSIYLTSYQSIPFTPSSENYRSFPSPPESVQSYSNPQVIINSGRLVFNAKSDSILLSAQKSVNLSTNGSVNINTKNFLIDSGNIRLGSKDARESIIKGDTLYFQLDQMLKALLQMLTVLKTSTMAIDPSTVKADITKNQVYGNVETSLQLIQEDLESILSKNVKTI
jgi:hypothetical protein